MRVRISLIVVQMGLIKCSTESVPHEIVSGVSQIAQFVRQLRPRHLKQALFQQGVGLDESGGRRSKSGD